MLNRALQFDTSSHPAYNSARKLARRIRLVDQDAALSRRRSGVRTPYAAPTIFDFGFECPEFKIENSFLEKGV